MMWRTALHYTQLWLVLALASGQLTKDQMVQIVDLHNYYRSLVSPQAANMQRMGEIQCRGLAERLRFAYSAIVHAKNCVRDTSEMRQDFPDLLLLWDNAVSQVAANYAALCRWEHNPNIYGVLGENLFMTLGPLTVTLPLKLWFNETVNYNFNTNSCNKGTLCGHYTQMVWANTTFIGCAAQFCANVPNFNVKNAIILVCNYYPPGNIMGQSPYEAGAACSACTSATIGCVSGACDRGTGLTSGITSDVIGGLKEPGNSTFNVNAGSSAGFVKPSAATLLLAALTAFYK